MSHISDRVAPYWQSLEKTAPGLELKTDVILLLNSKMIRRVAKQLLFLLLSASMPVSASEWIELESKVLGNGWFEYRLKVHDNPYLTYTDIFSFGIPGSFEEFVPPTGWYRDTNVWSPEYTGFERDGIPSEMPYELVFTGRSSAPYYESNNVSGLLTVGWNDDPLGALGIFNMPALVPSQTQTPGLAPGMVFNYGIGDVKIDALIRTNNQVHGLQFSWQRDCTVQLEASHNLKQWDRVARFWGTPPTTTWITNTSLNSLGKFFRLALVAQYHMPLSTNSLLAPPLRPDPAKILNWTVNNETMNVAVETIPGSRYSVVMKNLTGKAMDQRTINATNAVTNVTLTRTPTDTIGMIEAWLEPNPPGLP